MQLTLMHTIHNSATHTDTTYIVHAIHHGAAYTDATYTVHAAYIVHATYTGPPK